MSKQVKTMKVDHRKIYKADGIVRINDDLELILVETAGPFRKEDACKTAFDNSKGMFALLAMLKTIADKYYFASCQSFKKLKVLYLQPSDCYLRLWQTNYSKNGHYEYIRVAKAVVSEEEKAEEACLCSLNQFTMKMKVRIELLVIQ
ncbi:hypothetical protein A0J61_03740 [Choanephora cucurbitarum]|uniref:Uncharacterized protein n=1 Tax=Choanephora cucurbitarum TaxID=101091 RepID=A0A1C7NHH9_9FUNG|nr:hypothetical protein A0J61_03740 [Choanephora cucurbitarum]